MKIKWIGLVSLAFVFNVVAGDVPWDGEGVTQPGSIPDPRWDNKDNWAGDTFPGTGDRALLKPPINTAFVHLVLQATEVGSIDCRVPLKLDTKLILNGPSEITDALLPDGEGSIRSSSSVVFKGVNDARRVGFEGSGTFENQGTLLLANDVASAQFVNNGPCVVLSNGTVRLDAFLNNNAFALSQGALASGSITNRGSFSLGTADGEIAIMAGTLTQESGILSVPADALASITGGTQHYTGGSISVEQGGELALTYTGGPLNGREFNGMRTISGSGNIDQRTAYDVKQNLNLSVDAPGRYSADDLNIESSAILNNKKQLELPGGARLTGDGLLYNTGTMATFNNPTLDVNVENAGVWNSGSFRLGTQTILNRGRLNLSGNNLKITKSGSNPGVLLNHAGGHINVENGAFTYSIDVPFEQTEEGSTEVVSGTLRFQTLDPITLAGRFTANTNGIYHFYSALHQSGGGEILFDGEGTAILGAVPWLSTFVINSGDSVLTKMGDFRQESANIIMQSGTSIRNERNYSWKGGGIYSTENSNANREFRNLAPTLIIEQGGTKRLGVKLFNGGESQSAYTSVDQYNTITLLDGSTTNGTGQIINEAVWDIKAIANIQGRTQTNAHSSAVSLLNVGDFNHRHAGSSTIGVDLLNTGSIQVHEGVLKLEHVHNLSEDGVLSGGTWASLGGSFSFSQGAPRSLRNGARWFGKIASITNVGSSVTSEKMSELYVVGDDILTSPLKISRNGILSMGYARSLKLTDTLDVEGRLAGSGKIIGPVRYSGHQSSFIAPGSSPGTLTIEGDLTFANTIYEWETTGTNLGQSDLLVVTNDTMDAVASLSGGIAPMLLDDYAPAPGTVYTAMVADVISGQFDYVSHAYLPPGLTFTPEYTAGMVTLTAGTTNFTDFADWQAAHFSPYDLTNGVAVFSADPDGDRLKNLAEYAHGFSPMASNDGGGLSLSQPDSTSMELRFPWVDGLADIGYEVHTSPTLTGVFTNTSFSLESVTSDGVVSEITLRVPIAPDSTNMFYKLQIVPVE